MVEKTRGLGSKIQNQFVVAGKDTQISSKPSFHYICIQHKKCAKLAEIFLQGLVRLLLIPKKIVYINLLWKETQII